LARALARLPFTLLLEASILGVALSLGLFDPEVGARWREREGFGWPSLVEGRYHTLLTSTFLVDDAWQWARIALLLTWTVGLLEWREGTRRSVWIYAVTNLASCLAAAAAQGVAAALAGPDIVFAQSRDVGASAGAFGCLGALLPTLPARWRRPLAGLVLAYLALKALVFPTPSSDAVHAVALALGYAFRSRPER
jgi:membrane associated rhomboid family serine protease